MYALFCVSSICYFQILNSYTNRVMFTNNMIIILTTLILKSVMTKNIFLTFFFVVQCAQALRASLVWHLSLPLNS